MLAFRIVVGGGFAPAATEADPQIIRWRRMDRIVGRIENEIVRLTVHMFYHFSERNSYVLHVVIEQ